MLQIPPTMSYGRRCSRIEHRTRYSILALIKYSAISYGNSESTRTVIPGFVFVSVVIFHA